MSIACGVEAHETGGMRGFLVLMVMGAGCAWSQQEKVRFQTQILPLLSDRCLSCHGQDPGSRAAGLRLDTREGALAARRNGAAIVAGKPEESLLLARVQPKDPKRLMPPAYSHKKPLTQEEAGLLRRWIEEGASWERHWSFELPVKVQLSGKGNPIDEFVRKRLERENLSLMPAAGKAELARRLSFDLTGLPPGGAALEAFLRDTTSGADERYVDALLASEHYGERMAMWWLDVARYSDTDGFQADSNRTNWPWRDWVISAFNRNMRYDQFTREQLAGDLLPQASKEQILATAFHRNHMTNGEGGRDPEESRIDYVLDRTNTTGTAWLGLTLGCAQCHSHKFDPVSHQEYYSMTAFFNSIDEDGQAGARAKPYLSYESQNASRAIAEVKTLLEARKAREVAVRQAARPVFEGWLKVQRSQLVPTYSPWKLVRAKSLEASEGSVLVQDAGDGVIRAEGPNPRQDDYRVIAALPKQKITGLKLEVLPPLSRGKSGEFLLTDVKLQVRKKGSAQVRDVLLSKAIADFEADKEKNNNYGKVQDTLDDDPRNGWTTLGSPKDKEHVAVFTLAEALMLNEDEELVFEMRHRSTLGDANLANFRLLLTDQVGPVLGQVGLSPLEELAREGRVDDGLKERLFEQFLAGHEPHVAVKLMLERAQRQMDEVKGSGKVNVMVMSERAQPRTANILLRGVWDQKGPEVKPDVLSTIALWPKDAPRNRLGLAEWILAKENPLAGRVAVNHIWQLMFGAGLVRTTEDFGLQGERPVHQELLDWLAVDFVESGWDVKRLVKLIVLSDVYRQSSKLSPELIERDPENKLLARGARYRLPSWMLRDAALVYAGLLNPAVGGPPVKPYQPAGVWEELFMGRFRYEASEGAAQYRRTLYGFWRRSIAPTFLFDSAQRRSCEVRVGRTNTPLQALTLLNDETYLEASRVLAELVVNEKRDVATSIFTRVLGRQPMRDELSVLQREHQKALKFYRGKPAEAMKWIEVGQQAAPARKAPEVAAAMVVASMVMNLDEVMTHE